MSLRASNERLIKAKEAQNKLMNKIETYKNTISDKKESLNQQFDNVINNIDSAKLSPENALLRNTMKSKASYLSELTIKNEQLMNKLKEQRKNNEFKLSYLREKAEYAETKAVNDKKRADSIKSLDHIQKEIEKLKKENDKLQTNIENLQNEYDNEVEKLNKSEENLVKKKKSKEKTINSIEELKDQIESLGVAQKESNKLAKERDKGLQHDLAELQLKLEEMKVQKQKLQKDVSNSETRKQDLQYDLKLISGELSRALMAANKYVSNDF